MKGGGGIRFLGIFVCVIQGLTLTGQVRVEARLDTNFMLIGDRNKLYIKAITRPEVSLSALDISKIDTSGKVEWMGESVWKESGPGSFSNEVLFTVFDSGQYVLSPVPVVFLFSNVPDTVFSEVLTFQVTNPPFDSLGLEDIKPIFIEPRNWEDNLHYFYALVALLLLGLWWWWSRRPKKHSTPIVPPEIEMPPHTYALQQLEGLRQSRLWQKGDLKVYYSQLTFILREYLERRFNFPALESTTDEIIENLRMLLLEKSVETDAIRALQTADLVKFAKAKPPAETHEQWIDRVADFVQKTVPAPPVSELQSSEPE